jgi:hypothetical protein
MIVDAITSDRERLSLCSESHSGQVAMSRYRVERAAVGSAEKVAGDDGA